MEDVDPTLAGVGESPMKHHLFFMKILTLARHPGGGPRQRVSLTGAVSSQRVTEEREGWLSVVGNHVLSALA